MYCVDRPATVAAIETLVSGGVQVYVIGIPGSDLYGDVLNEMAITGGAPQPSPPHYYRVSDLEALGTVLGSIAEVLVSCEFTVSDPPAEPGMTNVYLDQELLAYGYPNGWVWKTVDTVELVGESCARLKAGQVKQVQIVSGCPTETTK